LWPQDQVKLYVVWIVSLLKVKLQTWWRANRKQAKWTAANTRQHYQYGWVHVYKGETEYHPTVPLPFYEMCTFHEYNISIYMYIVFVMIYKKIYTKIHHIYTMY